MIDHRFNRTAHGSLYDRGSADSYYCRSRDPHWWTWDHNGSRCTIPATTQEEVLEYQAGYDYNDVHGDKKYHVCSCCGHVDRG